MWRDDRLLMQRRAADASHGGGCWSVPGGWCDYGEHPSEAVLRELREEAGLIGSHAALADVVANTYDALDLHVVCTFYDVVVHEGEPVNVEPDKADVVLWVPQDEVAALTPRFPPFDDLIRGGYLARRRRTLGTGPACPEDGEHGRMHNGGTVWYCQRCGATRESSLGLR